MWQFSFLNFRFVAERKRKIFQWEAFEIPELNNFIKILELEEKEYMKRIRHKYIIYRRYVKLEMSERKLSTDCFDSRKNFDVDHVTLPPVEPLSPTDSIDGETLGTQKGAEKDDDYDFNDSGTLKTQKGTQQDDDYDYNDSGTMRILKAS